MTFRQNAISRETNPSTEWVSKIKFKIIPAPEKLKQAVECFRIAEYTGQDKLAIKVSLNGLPGIVFQHNKGRPPVESIITPSRRNFDVPLLYVYGQQTQPSVMNNTGPFTMTQAILKPHALKTLLGMNASSLTNRLVELREFSTRDLNLQLIEAKNEQERIALLTNFLLVQLQQENTRDRLVEESLNLIQKDVGSITVRYLLEHLHISERQFERRFTENVGISPQFYIRVKRFNKAVRLIKTRQFDRLTDVAYALNFYDQSHFTRDIKAFSGITPKNLSQNENDFNHGQAGYSFV
jgi:AraC-like DNA-binding protein